MSDKELQYECPFCQGRFSNFLPDGLDLPVLKEKRVVSGQKSEHVNCPNCYSFDRERHLYLYLKQKTNIFTHKLSVLHFAPERMLSKTLSALSNLTYVTADLNPRNVMMAMDITNLKFQINSFDVIICSHVLEHVQDDIKALAELFRVLKPNGWAIIQVPIALGLDRTFEDPRIQTPEDRARAYGQHDHFRLYGMDYIHHLTHAGFMVETFSFTKEKGEEASRRYGLIPEEELFICRKPYFRLQTMLRKL